MALTLQNLGSEQRHAYDIAILVIGNVHTNPELLEANE